MIIIVSSLLFLLSIINYLFARTFLYPPFIFSFLWALLLLILKCAGSMFYSISNETLLIFLFGAIAFSLGGFIPLLLKRSRRKEKPLLYRENRWPEYIINIILLFSICFLPYYVYCLVKAGISSGFGNFWMGLKYQMVNNKANLGVGLFRIQALVGFTSILSYLEYKLGRLTKKKALIMILIALFYELSTTQRVGAFRLICALLGVKFVLERRINYRFLLTTIVLGFFAFVIPAILVEQISKTGNLSAKFLSATKLTLLYGEGGLIAFDRVIATPTNYIGPRLATYRFFLALSNALGYTNFELPKLIPILTFTPLPTNVYTMYFSYFMDFGYLGVFGLTFLIGIVSSFIFIHAYYDKNEIYIFLYGIMIIATILISSMNEIFYTSISYWLQAILFILVAYKIPMFFKRRKDEKRIRFNNN
jgi:oligosaccharide repeat unit polymerase